MLDGEQFYYYACTFLQKKYDWSIDWYSAISTELTNVNRRTDKLFYNSSYISLFASVAR